MCCRDLGGKNSKETLVDAIRQVQEEAASTGVERVKEDMHSSATDVEVPGGVADVLYSMVEAAGGGGQADPVARGGDGVAALTNRLVTILCDFNAVQ